MKKFFSPSLLLFGLVLTIYLARQSDLSLSRSFGQSLRRLADEYRPSSDLCGGVNLNEPVSASDKKKAKNFAKSVDGLRGGNPLMDFVDDEKDKDDFGSDYVVGLIAVIAPWIAFFFITAIVCITLCCNWCCMYGCCKGCKACACCKVPKKTSKKKIFAGFTALFLICTLAASITGLTFSSGVTDGMELTLCSFINVLENLAYGNPTDKWIGITGAIEQLDVVIQDLQTTLGSVNNFDTDINAYDNQFAITKTAIHNLYDNNKALTAKSASDGLTTYKPNYITNLGPETTETTYSGMILKEVQTKKDVVDNTIGPISTSAGQLKSNNNLQSQLESGRKSASEISDEIRDILDTLGDDGKTAKDVIKIIGNALTGVFAANVALSVFAFTSMIMVGIVKIKFFNKLLHLSWCLITLLTLLGFLLAIFTYPVSVVMMEGCEVFDTALNDEAFFTKLMNNYFDDKKDVRDTLAECIYGDGNMLSQFDIEQQMEQFDTIFTNIDEVEKKYDIDSGSAPASIAIPVNEDLVTNFKNGKYIDSDDTANNLKTVNQKVNHNTASPTGCTPFYDTWVLNKINCTSSMGSVWTTATSDADYLTATCIGFDQWLLKPGHITSRYTGSSTPSTDVSSCSGGVPTMQGYITNFETNRGSIDTLFTTVGNDLSTVKTENGNLDAKLVTIFTDLKNLRNGVASIEDALMGKESGIIPNTNCKFIANDLRRLTDSVCYGFIASLYQTSLVIIITAFFSLFSTIAVFCLAKRFLIEPEKQNAKITSQ